jgi:RNA recognition motif-containing protein
MKIYVGNLSFKTTDEGLRAAFEQMGEVKSAEIVMDRETNRSKGFGFVVMPNDDEARKAIESLDNTELETRTIRVNEARATRPGGSRGDRPRRY